MQERLKRILIVIFNIVTLIIGAYNFLLGLQSFNVSLPFINIVALICCVVCLFLMTVALVNLVKPVNKIGILHMIANGVVIYFIASYFGFVLLALILNDQGYISFPISFIAAFLIGVAILFKKWLRAHNN